jgi:hypothetical protein
MQREDRQFLVIPPIRSAISAVAKENEISGAVPILHNIETFMNLAAAFAEPEIAAEKDGPTRFAQCQQGGVGGVLDMVPRKAPQHRGGLGGAKP